jgi:hypothetical protein
VSYVWRRYESDDGFIYAVKVSVVYAGMSERGYTQPALGTDIQYPRGWRERRVIGIADSGGLVAADVASTIAPLWTGAEGRFTYQTGAGSLAGATVIGRREERMLPIYADPAASTR